MCTCRLMSSRAPNAPPTPPSTRRTCSSARPRQAAIWRRSSCIHCVATCSSTPRPSSSGMARAASSPRNAWSCMPMWYVPSTTTSPVASGSPWTMRWWRSTLPSGWIGALRAGDRRLRVEQRRQHLVLDGDRGHGPSARLLVVGGDDGDRLADVAHEVAGEHRLVGGDQPVGRAARHVVGGEHGVHARGSPAPPTCRSTRSGRRDAASAASRPTRRRPSAGPTRRRTCRPPWPGRRVVRGESPIRFDDRARGASVTRHVAASARRAPRPAGRRRRCARSRCTGRCCRTAPRRSASASARRCGRAGRGPPSPAPACRTRTARRRRRRTPAGRRSVRSPSPAMPSIVTIGTPTALAARTRHEHTSSPSTSTLHEPHSPCSHAPLAPYSPSRSREHVEQALAEPPVRRPRGRPR